jgi:hypothetical protein
MVQKGPGQTSYQWLGRENGTSEAASYGAVFNEKGGVPSGSPSATNGWGFCPSQPVGTTLVQGHY